MINSGTPSFENGCDNRDFELLCNLSDRILLWDREWVPRGQRAKRLRAGRNTASEKLRQTNDFRSSVSRPVR